MKPFRIVRVISQCEVSDGFRHREENRAVLEQNSVAVNKLCDDQMAAAHAGIILGLQQVQSREIRSLIESISGNMSIALQSYYESPEVILETTFGLHIVLSPTPQENRKGELGLTHLIYARDSKVFDPKNVATALHTTLKKLFQQEQTLAGDSVSRYQRLVGTYQSVNDRLVEAEQTSKSKPD